MSMGCIESLYTRQIKLLWVDNNSSKTELKRMTYCIMICVQQNGIRYLCSSQHTFERKALLINQWSNIPIEGEPWNKLINSVERNELIEYGQ